MENAEKVKEVEIYSYRQLLKFMFGNLEVRGALFHSFALNWVVELVKEYGHIYNGLLTKDELVSILLEETLAFPNDDLETAFVEVLTVYYQTTEQEQIAEGLELQAVKERIALSRRSVTKEDGITKEQLFG